MNELGGRRIAIPGELAGRYLGALEERLERDLVVALVLHFGGQTIYIPHGGPLESPELETVVDLTKQGKSAGFIAGELRCSDRTVYAWRARARALGLLPVR